MRWWTFLVLGIDLWGASWWVHHCRQNVKPSLVRVTMFPCRSQAEKESLYVCTLESGASRNLYREWKSRISSRIFPLCNNSTSHVHIPPVRHVISWAGMVELSWLPIDKLVWMCTCVVCMCTWMYVYHCLSCCGEHKCLIRTIWWVHPQFSLGRVPGRSFYLLTGLRKRTL